MIHFEFLRQRRIIVATSLVAVLLIVGVGLFILSRQPERVCGGLPVQVSGAPYFPNRSVRITVTIGDQLWSGFADGGVGVVTTQKGGTFAELCSGPAQQSKITVNDIVQFNDAIYIATDGDGVWRLSNGTWFHFGENLTYDLRFYGLFVHPTEHALYGASFEGVQQLNGDKWEFVPYLVAPETSHKFHTISFIQGEWWVGTSDQGFIHRHNDGSWTKYDGTGEWHTENGGWVQDSQVQYPNNIRSILPVTSSLASQSATLAIVSADDAKNGLWEIRVDGFFLIPNAPLHQLVRAQQLSLNGQVLTLISDWQFGASGLVGSTWHNNLVQIPTFGGVVWNGKLLLATSNGLQEAHLP